jgi:hypothetical protein
MVDNRLKKDVRKMKRDLKKNKGRPLNKGKKNGIKK